MGAVVRVGLDLLGILAIVIWIKALVATKREDLAMTDDNPLPLPPSPPPDIARVTVGELITSIKAGMWDFQRAPLFGLFFSSFYVLIGLALWWVGAGTFLWTLAFALGFPLVAPFAAVGLYEVSRRIEADEALDWADVLGVVWSQRQRQIPWVGAILAMIFLFWSFFAHMLFALFLGPSVMTNIMSSWDAILSPAGYRMMGVQFIAGAGVAFLTYGLTVMSLPLLLDREVDFVSAMILSLKTVAANKAVLGLWAAIIAGLLFLAMLPAFLGLFLVLPVLGHATWHLYRRALYDPV